MPEAAKTYGVKLYGQFETAPGGTSLEAAEAYAKEYPEETDSCVYESEDGGRTWFPIVRPVRVTRGDADASYPVTPEQVGQSLQWLRDHGLDT